MPTFVDKLRWKCKNCSNWFTHCHLILEVREEEHWRLSFRFFIHPWKPYSNAFLLSLTGLHIHIWKPPLCRSPLQCRFRAPSAAVMRKEQMLPVHFSYPQYPVGFRITETRFSYTMSKLFGHQWSVKKKVYIDQTV